MANGQSGWRFPTTLILGLALALALGACGGKEKKASEETTTQEADAGSGPGGGTTARFRLLNRSKEKPISEIKIYKRTKDGGGNYHWEEVTDKQSPDAIDIVASDAWDDREFDPTQEKLEGIYGIKVEYKFGGASDPADDRSVELDELGWLGVPFNVDEVLVDVRRGGGGAATLHVLRSDLPVVRDEAGVGHGRFRVVNGCGSDLETLELYVRLENPNVPGTFDWVDVGSRLIDDALPSGADLPADGEFYAGHVPRLFRKARGLRVIWKTAADSGNRTSEWDETDTPFTSEQAVGEIVLTLVRVGASNRKGIVSVMLPGSGTALQDMKP